MSRIFVALLALLPALVVPPAIAAPLDPALFSALRYRHLGPFRGGRTKAATGIPGRPGVFLIGAVNGGVFRTDDYGRTWTPLFDGQPSASIGAIAVAPSDPDVIYVGSGEGMHRPDLSTGDGLYRSGDGGRTWAHLGLRDGQQIPQIAVDPKDPQRLYVAVLGHPYGPNEERGLFRSRDGGATFDKVLFIDADTGCADVVIDPSDPQTLLASLWEARQAPWENGSFKGPGSGLYKSSDGGTTWRRITNGLPTFEKDGLGRIGLAFAPSRPSRVFATVSTNKGGFLYRSDDRGESWSRISEDERIADRAEDAAEVKVHPLDPEVVFTASIVLWKSTDGGKTFLALKGAPGGDDYQKIWIDPQRPEVMLLGSDQGGAVSVNGGNTWSSWYNQPTAQLFHVTADDAFPYRVCGGQQESGSACVPSRGSDGAITFRDWYPAGFDEYGYGAPDPKDPDVVYGARVSRWDRRTGQSQDVSPEPLGAPDYRQLRTQPLVFSPVDKGTLFFAANRVFKTGDGGRHWTAISPDLSRKSWDAPAGVGKYRGSEDARPKQRGVVYALGPSPLDRGLLWAGTDDGLLHVTRDGGKSWKDVTPPLLTPWAKVSGLEASHFDNKVAWAAINTLRLDDLRPHLLRTRDGGKSWEETIAGLPAGAVCNMVREDPKRAGLLYLGTERGVFVSFDAGDAWIPLRLGLPATSVRDLIVKDDDLVLATHGRGFWVLDDLSPLRQAQPALFEEAARLLAPQRALRVHWNDNSDTPLPPDEPTAQNPPDGAVLHYWLKEAATGPLALEIADAAGRVVRRFASGPADSAAPEPRDQGNVPRWWIRPAAVLASQAGLHRFVWDLHEEPPPPPAEPSFPIAAIPYDTPAEQRGPWALPGRYTVRLAVAGRTLSQPLLVAMDPRVKTPLAALQAQHALSRRATDALVRVAATGRTLAALRPTLEAQATEATAKGDTAGAEALRARLLTLGQVEGSVEKQGRSPMGKPGAPVTLKSTEGRLRSVLHLLQQADAAPMPQVERAARTVLEEEAGLGRQAAALVAGGGR